MMFMEHKEHFQEEKDGIDDEDNFKIGGFLPFIHFCAEDGTVGGRFAIHFGLFNLFGLADLLESKGGS